MACVICNGNWVVIVSIEEINEAVGSIQKFRVPCPNCTPILDLLECLNNPMNVNIKVTEIPNAGIDDEDNVPCPLAIEDEITDTTIEDILNA